MIIGGLSAKSYFDSRLDCWIIRYIKGLPLGWQGWLKPGKTEWLHVETDLRDPDKKPSVSDMVDNYEYLEQFYNMTTFKRNKVKF